MRKRSRIARFVRLPRRLLRNQDGSAAVEFGIVAVPFLALLFGSLQLLILFVAQQILETATEQAGRQILTGQAQTMTQAQFQALVCSNLSSFLRCSNVLVDVQTPASFSAADTSTPVLTYDRNGNVTNTWGYNTGASGGFVVLRVMYQWPVFNFILKLSTQSNGTRLLMATAVFQNEPY